MAQFYKRLPRFQYLLPKTLEEALSFLKEHKEAARLFAGGTDLIPQLKKREVDIPRYLVDLKGIPGLDSIAFDEKAGLKIGPLATINAIKDSPYVRDHYPSLFQAASSMASPQVRNRGTFAGNICSAVPSADSAPALLALEASVRLLGQKGEREVPMDKFFIGPRKTVLEAGEMLLEIKVSRPKPGSRNVYLKLSPRHSMDLAIVGVAVAATCDGGVCKDIKIALGAVAPTPIRVPAAEKILEGNRITPEIIEEASQNAAAQCSPIDDHRASLEYRRDMVYILARRALNNVLTK
ncbi:MAG TPA: xanthine dehydrogenase family protein subunit M [Syntrophorhabdaceae bacterium]|nr:xanthine dehydrogenase family protein subunit M [Syntrophorhabdaceae bacterium]HQM82356.1 xanthine dehydrogenase family protein subunit M [Syntrophorhabdaceae bacterium]